jgi:V8-like Glu-specific endopeptidase
MNAGFSFVGLMIAVCGCSGADGTTLGEKGPESAPSEQSDEPTGQITEPIFGGTPGSGPAVVGLIVRQQPCSAPTSLCVANDCTGAIVSRNAILTAGHCITDTWHKFGSNLYVGPVAVTYMDPRDRTFKCLTRTTGSIVGACSNTDADYTSMVGLVDASGNTTTGVAHDIAVIGTGQLNWPGLDQTDAARIATSSARDGGTGAAARVGDSFNAIGYGGDGTNSLRGLRFAPAAVRVDSVSGGVIGNNANAVRMCKGDSGSPAMVYLSAGHPITFGVHSGGPHSGDCTTPGARQNWAQTQTEIGVINQGLAIFGTPCTDTRYAMTANIVMNVRECW